LQPAPSAPDPVFAAAAPEALLPEAVLPEAVLPDAVLPDAALPDAVLPDAALPDAVLPDAALPEVVQAAQAGARLHRLRGRSRQGPVAVEKSPVTSRCHQSISFWELFRTSSIAAVFRLSMVPGGVRAFRQLSRPGLSGGSLGRA
jgi:hypothetical protein